MSDVGRRRGGGDDTGGKFQSPQIPGRWDRVT